MGLLRTRLSLYIPTVGRKSRSISKYFSPMVTRARDPIAKVTSARGGPVQPWHRFGSEPAFTCGSAATRWWCQGNKSQIWVCGWAPHSPSPMTTLIAKKTGLKIFEKHLRQYEPTDPLYETYADENGRQRRRKVHLYYPRTGWFHARASSD